MFSKCIAYVAQLPRRHVNHDSAAVRAILHLFASRSCEFNSRGCCLHYFCASRCHQGEASGARIQRVAKAVPRLVGIVENSLGALDFQKSHEFRAFLYHNVCSNISWMVARSTNPSFPSFPVISWFCSTH